MLVIGAKGFAKQLFELFCQLNELDNLYFYDDLTQNCPDSLFGKYPVLKSQDEAKELFRTNNSFTLGIGNPYLRYKLANKFINLGGSLSSVISPKAYIGKYENNIGNGVNILTGVIIENNVHISKGVLLNLNCTITHDTSIGEFSEISVGAHLSGGSVVGNFCSIGTGAVLLPKVKLGNNVVVGAGAVVVDNIDDNTVVAGVPARILRKTDPLIL
jgi:sugar O-acyltransferase (sialic acid O-acetyltransferase NeuD family)